MLNSGQAIPQLGFGVFKIDPDETAAAAAAALKVGYRHLDTAEMYRNEMGFQITEETAFSRFSILVATEA